MRKLLLTIFGVTILFFNVNAQFKYKDIKHLYNPKDYVRQPGDMYNPAMGGIASLIIPGLGQMISEEGGRGAGFLVSYIALYSITFASAPKVDDYGNVIKDGNPGLATIALFGAIGVGIASIVDAVKIAKVKNLAYNAKYDAKIKLELNPYVGSFSTIKGSRNTVGVSLALKFR